MQRRLAEDRDDQLLERRPDDHPAPAAVLYGQNFYYKRPQKVPLVIPED